MKATFASTTVGGWDIALMLNKRQLLGSMKWKPRNRDFLDTLPDVFPIMPIIDEAMKGYEYIERKTLRIYLAYVESWLDAAQELLDRLGPYQGHPYLFAIPPDESKSMFTFNEALGGVPLMTQEYIDKVKWALAQPDPIGAMWLEHEEERGFILDQASVLKATQVMASFYSGGPEAAQEQIVDLLLSDRGLDTR